MTEGGIEQYGYIDIKQPPKVKGRKLKVGQLLDLISQLPFTNDKISVWSKLKAFADDEL